MKKSIFYFGLALFLLVNNVAFAQVIDEPVDPQQVEEPDDSLEQECEELRATYLKYFKSKHCYCKDVDIPDLKAAKAAFVKDIYNSLKCDKSSCDDGFGCDKHGPWKVDSYPPVAFEPTMEEMDGPDGMKVFCTYYMLTFDWECSVCERDIAKEGYEDTYEKRASGHFTSKESLMEFRPNPSSGMFNVHIFSPDETTAIEIQICDVSGKILFSQEYSTGQNKELIADVDLSTKANGIYIATLYSGETILETQKIVIKK